MTESTGATDHGATQEKAGPDSLTRFLDRYDRLLNKVYAFITRRMNDDADTGGVFMATVKSFYGYAEKRDWDLPEEEYTPLLFRIAARRIIDSRRVHNRTWGSTDTTDMTDTSVYADLKLLAGVIDDPLDDPFEDVIRRIDVQKALNQLDERPLQVLTLRYVDGLTLQETAAILGVSVTRIFNISRNATQLLRNRRLLESYGPPMRRPSQNGSSEAQA